MRNHVAQEAIEKAERGEFDRASALLKILEQPYTDEPMERILVSEKCKYFGLYFG